MFALGKGIEKGLDALQEQGGKFDAKIDELKIKYAKEIEGMSEEKKNEFLLSKAKREFAMGAAKGAAKGAFGFMGNMAKKASNAVTSDAAKDMASKAYDSASGAMDKASGFMGKVSASAKDAYDSASEEFKKQDTNLVGVYPSSPIAKSKTNILGDFPKDYNQKNNKKTNVLGQYGKDVEYDDAFEDEDEQILFQDIASVARTGVTRVYDSGSNLVITQFVYMLDKTIDLMTYFTLGYRSLNSIDKQEIINNLKGKRDILMKIAYDPKAQKIIRDMSFALANILSEVVGAAGPTIQKAQEKLANSIGGGIDKVSARAMASLRNMIRIIPGAGDAFIIMENMFKIGQVATDIGKTFATSTQTFTDAYKDIKDNTAGNPVIKEQMDFFKKSASEFQHIRDKIKGKMGGKFDNLPKNYDEAELKIKTGINNSTKKVAGVIDSVRDGLIKKQTNEFYGGNRKKNAKRKRKLKKQRNKHVFRSRKKCIKINLSSTRKNK